MAWSEEQLRNHPKINSLLAVNSKIQSNASEKTGKSEKSLPAPAASCHFCAFTVLGPAMGKPRMTQRDRWKQRPCVMRYRDYCDRIRGAAPRGLAERDCFALDTIAYIAVKPSWSKKKQAAMIGQPHRTKPDADNLTKGAADSLFEEDSGIWDMRGRKFWCAADDERTEIKISFNP